MYMHITPGEVHQLTYLLNLDALSNIRKEGTFIEVYPKYIDFTYQGILFRRYNGNCITCYFEEIEQVHPSMNTCHSIDFIHKQILTRYNQKLNRKKRKKRR